MRETVDVGRCAAEREDSERGAGVKQWTSGAVRERKRRKRARERSPLEGGGAKTVHLLALPQQKNEFTCFTSTKVQILAPKAEVGGGARIVPFGGYQVLARRSSRQYLYFCASQASKPEYLEVKSCHARSCMSVLVLLS